MTTTGSRRFSGLLVALLAALLFSFALAPGCETVGVLAQPKKAWVKADRATYDAVAPKLSAYLEADPAIAEDPDILAAWNGLLDDWRLRLESAEADVGISPGTPTESPPPDPAPEEGGAS